MEILDSIYKEKYVFARGRVDSNVSVKHNNLSIISKKCTGEAL